MNNQLEDNLMSLEYKIKRLIEANRFLNQQLHKTMAENNFLKEEVKRKEEELNNFQNKFKISKIVGHVAVNGGTAELKSKINEYIKEIDKCITHLSA
jgi:chaperonin cofactor prefoldin